MKRVKLNQEQLDRLNRGKEVEIISCMFGPNGRNGKIIIEAQEEV